MLPVNYKKLSFIENAESGSYIDTGHYATTDTKVVVDGCVIDGDTALFGSRKSMNANDCYALQFTSELYYRFSFNTSKIAASKNYEKGIRHTFTVSKEGFYIDTSLIGTPATKTISSIYPIYALGAMNTGGEAASLGIARIYSLRIYEGADLVYDFIPCISDNGEYGLYDEVGGAFYGNAGSGEFSGEEEAISGIMVSQMPDKTTYEIGEEFDPTGLAVDVVYIEGCEVPISDYELSGFDSSTPGAKPITITYEGHTTVFYVVVTETPPGPSDFLTLEEMKQYLRVDHEDDDSLIEYLINASIKRCMDIARVDERTVFEAMGNAKMAVMYSVAFQYEHREDANFNDLNLTLRALLFGDRREAF